MKHQLNNDSINPLKPERPDIRSPSKRCLSGLPEPARITGKKSTEPKKINVSVQDALASRYDDYALDCAAVALAENFIEKNANLPEGEWLAPSAIEQLNSIHSKVTGGKTFGGTPFRVTLAANHRVLFVGVVEVDDHCIRGVKVEKGRGFGYTDLEIPCYSVRVLVSASSCEDHRNLELPVLRKNNAFRKFSLPKSRRRPGPNYVSGPYLAVGAYEPNSGVFARMRLFPVWLSQAADRMTPVRSGLERAAAAALAKNGSVSFTFLNKRQLRLLHHGLGHRWGGDVSSYPYQPDFLMMANANEKPVVAELFGMRNIKRYDESKYRKKAAGASNPAIRFAFLEGPGLSPAAVEDWVAKMLNNAENGIWTSARSPMSEKSSSPI